MSEQYCDDTIAIVSAATAIRRRLSLYLDLEQPDLAATLAMQALCHAVDEHLGGRCTRVALQIAGNRIQVRYDAGMPLQPQQAFPEGSIVMDLLTQLRACHSRKKHLAVGDEFCEIGLAVLNAVCSESRAEIHDRGWRASLRFTAGELQESSAPQPAQQPDSTLLQFTLDASLLPDCRPGEAALRSSVDALRRRFPELAVDLVFADAY